jgi:nitrite reductase/ring-hydroxylating ferredoxin subunit
VALAGILLDPAEVGASGLAWPQIAKASSVPVHGLLPFAFGASSGWSRVRSSFGSPSARYQGLLYRRDAGTTAASFVAYVLRCPHAGGSVGARPLTDARGKATTLLGCPIHGSRFDETTGSAVSGVASFLPPPSDALPEVRVSVAGAGASKVVSWAGDGQSNPSQYLSSGG